MKLQDWIKLTASQVSILVALAALTAGFVGTVWSYNKATELADDVRENTHHRIRHETLLSLPRIDRSKKK
jgi:hypothetical protein